METVHTSRMSVNFYQTAWCYITDDSTLHCHCCGNLKLSVLICLYTLFIIWLYILIFPKKIPVFIELEELGYSSGYSDWLWAGWLRGWSSSPSRVKKFLFSTSSRPALGSTQPPIRWVPRALSPGVKRPGREADHLPPVSAEVKKMWIYASSSPYISMRSA
jgi:hypothetical protein